MTLAYPKGNAGVISSTDAAVVLRVECARWFFARHGHDIPPQHIGPLGDDIPFVLGAEADRAFDQPELETEPIGGTPDPIEPDRAPSCTVTS